jgi:hypothetical protein
LALPSIQLRCSCCKGVVVLLLRSRQATIVRLVLVPIQLLLLLELLLQHGRARQPGKLLLLPLLAGQLRTAERPGSTAIPWAVRFDIHVLLLLLLLQPGCVLCQAAAVVLLLLLWPRT